MKAKPVRVKKPMPFYSEALGIERAEVMLRQGVALFRRHAIPFQSILIALCETYGDVSGHNCGWCTGGAGPVWGRPLGVEVRQVLRLVSLVIARSATGDLVTVQGRLC